MALKFCKLTCKKLGSVPENWPITLLKVTLLFPTFKISFLYKPCANVRAVNLLVDNVGASIPINEVCAVFALIVLNKGSCEIFTVDICYPKMR